MRSIATLVPALLLLIASTSAPVFGQYRVDKQNQNERIVAVVPLTGAGTYADPKRPLFVPAAPKDLAKSRLLSFQWKPTDDGKSAIVEFAARSRAPLLEILRDRRVIVAFEKGKAKKDDIEKELRKHRKDYALDDREDRRGR